jgi:2-iminobutanoate/2-iminopropanoate deaminase
MNASSRQEFRVDSLPEPVSHYTDAVRWGDLLYVSGCVAVTSGGQVAAPGDAQAQAEMALGYLGRALQAAGTGPAHVLKVTVFLTRMADRVAVNEARKKFFGDARPASTLVEVSALILPELLVEVEAVAGIPG